MLSSKQTTKKKKKSKTKQKKESYSTFTLILGRVARARHVLALE